MSMSEHMFLRQDYHSIIPFLLISNKEVHRLCLSDYEIKQTLKSFNDKAKNEKLDCFEFYRIGLINFYKGHFLNSYHNFKTAYQLLDIHENLSNNKNFKISYIQANICKWLAFSLLVLIFCGENIIDFTIIKHINQEEVSNNQERKNTDDFSIFNSCCTVRKNQKLDEAIKSRRNRSSSMDMSSTTNQTNFHFDKSHFLNRKINEVKVYCKEILEILNLVSKCNKNALEGWWIYMYIGIYCKLNKEQTLFVISKETKDTSPLYDPKFCVKKIKEYDQYLSYIAYSELTCIFSITSTNLNENSVTPKIDEILSELIFKYQNRYEAYLKYWQLLTCKNSLYKNYKKALVMSEVFWNKSSGIGIDDNFYYPYLLITYAKSAYLLGNSYHAITFLQKEFLTNFMYPSIFYLVSFNIYMYVNYSLGNLLQNQTPKI
jgi:hypothetical protein